jgi:hypothetical protein
MTTWAFKTIIVQASLVEAARNVGACLDAAGSGMYTTPLSADGSLPATHYISSGLMSAAFMPLLADAAMMFGAAQQGATAQGLTLTATHADCTALVAQSDVSGESPHEAMARLGLKMIGEPAQ